MLLATEGNINHCIIYIHLGDFLLSQHAWLCLKDKDKLNGKIQKAVDNDHRINSMVINCIITFPFPLDNKYSKI